MCEALVQWPEYFSISAQKVEYIANSDMQACSRTLDKVVHQLIDQGVIAHYLEEVYPVTGNNRNPLFATLDRGSAAYFGIRAYGQHLNGYVRDEHGLSLWVARRAADRIHFPNMLDNMVAGGLPHDLSLEDNLVKECQEEANLPADLVKNARATGAISYCCETEVGLKPDTLYCYDLELPRSFMPQNTDGEVAEFVLWDIREVIQSVLNTDNFKANCNLVILDFCIRHGFINPGQADYLELVNGLHL